MVDSQSAVLFNPRGGKVDDMNKCPRLEIRMVDQMHVSVVAVREVIVENADCEIQVQEADK